MQKIMIIAVLSAIMMTGCTSRELTRNDILQSWVGAHIDDIIGKWGTPTTAYKNRNGTVLYEWKQKPWVSNIGKVHECVQTFLADQQGILMKWKYSDCSYYVNGDQVSKDIPIPQPTL